LHDVAREFPKGTDVSFVAVYRDAAFCTCHSNKKFLMSNLWYVGKHIINICWKTILISFCRIQRQTQCQIVVHISWKNSHSRMCDIAHTWHDWLWNRFGKRDRKQAKQLLCGNKYIVGRRQIASSLRSCVPANITKISKS